MHHRRLTGRQKKMGKLSQELPTTFASQPCCSFTNRENHQKRGKPFCTDELEQGARQTDQNADQTYLEKLKEEARIMSKNLEEIESRIEELKNRREVAL